MHLPFCSTFLKVFFFFSFFELFIVVITFFSTFFYVFILVLFTNKWVPLGSICYSTLESTLAFTWSSLVHPLVVRRVHGCKMFERVVIRSYGLWRGKALEHYTMQVELGKKRQLGLEKNSDFKSIHYIYIDIYKYTVQIQNEIMLKTVMIKNTHSFLLVVM